MENDKPNIKEELNHIRESINKKKDKKEIINDENDFILLDKIVVKSNKEMFKISNNKGGIIKNTSYKNHKPLENKEKKNDVKSNNLNKGNHNKKLASTYRQ